MGSCYLGDHIAGDHINTDITTCNNEEPQQKYRLGTEVIDNWGIEHILQDPNPPPFLLEWFETFGPHEGFLTHQ